MYRYQNVLVKVSPSEKEKIRYLAHSAGLSVSSYVRLKLCLDYKHQPDLIHAASENYLRKLQQLGGEPNG